MTQIPVNTFYSFKPNTSNAVTSLTLFLLSFISSSPQKNTFRQTHLRKLGWNITRYRIQIHYYIARTCFVLFNSPCLMLKSQWLPIILRYYKLLDASKCLNIGIISYYNCIKHDRYHSHYCIQLLMIYLFEPISQFAMV